ncbi:MAG: peptide-methionine (S)-S-oxide reductase MsrA [Planctomycetaceae bacterium]
MSSEAIGGSCLLISSSELPDPAVDLPCEADAGSAFAVLGGGCFWCTEAVYRQLEGVVSVVSGYAGGAAETAAYQAVCGGNTGHAEVIRIEYDPRRLSYGQLLKVFFAVAHDPTQLNQQGADRGTQYRSAIFVDGPGQRQVAEAYIAQLQAAKVFRDPIVTTLEPLEAFYPAEEYHQDYAARNPMQPYIQSAATPKVIKLRKAFPNRLKADG